MLSEQVYAALEQRISFAFSNAPNKSLRGYYCDGILAPEWAEDWRPAHVRQTRQIVLRAWLNEGQQKHQPAAQRPYRLRLRPGPHALAAYLRGHELTRCLPACADGSTVLLDPDNQLIDVLLS